MRYDFIIIGGGLAGLYMAYLLRTTTNASFIVLEKSNRFGGRAYNEKFAGVSVPTGAGIGRKVPDQLLLKLMKQLDLPIKFFPVEHHYSPRVESVDIDWRFDQLKSVVSPFIRDTFKSVASQIWGKDNYNNFLIYNGYRDMEQEDIQETLTNYRIKDNYKKWTGFNVDWNMLVKRLSNHIGLHRLFINQSIHQIHREHDGFIIRTPQRIYDCKQIIFATPPEVIEHFFGFVPGIRMLYSNIGTQPFLRTYVQFDAPSTEIIKHYIQGTTIVSNLLQKIIPIQPDKGIYMIAYSDNRNAVNGSRLTAEQIVQKLSQEFNIRTGTPLHILHLQHYFWKIGTHYYKPLHPRFSNRLQFIRAAQQPLKDVYVIGDWISRNQGWVEGALESVQRIIASIRKQRF